MRDQPLPRRNFFNMTYMMERLVTFEKENRYLGSLSSSLSSIYHSNRKKLLHHCSGKDLFSFCQENVIITFDSSRKAYFTYKPHLPPSPTENPQLTFVAHTSCDHHHVLSSRVDRLSYLPLLLQRWPGPLSLSIIAYPDKLCEVHQAMRLVATRRNSHVVIYIPSKFNYVWKGTFDDPKQRKNSIPIYPINLLRNLAILNVRTTHYINMDMDLWPSVTLLDTFANLPREVLDDPKSALILPAFQFEKSLRKLYGNGERSISQ
jgi:singapore isolate B (sub-type 7) whole genome shotgun sequence assembly, scaffold_11